MSALVVGGRKGQWTLLEKTASGTRAKWRCRCDCGTEREVYQHHLSSGASRSCGCTKKTHHNHALGHLSGGAHAR